jgi:hypothetical protein
MNQDLRKMLKELDNAFAKLERDRETEQKKLDTLKEKISKFENKYPPCEQLEQQNVELQNQIELLKKSKQQQDFRLVDRIDRFSHCLSVLSADKIKGERINELFLLYSTMKNLLEKAEKITQDKTACTQYGYQALVVDQIETIIDLYGEKIKKVKSDTSLDEGEREEKLSAWKMLRDKHISELEGT